MEGAGRRLVQLEEFIIPALEETGKSLGHGAYGEVLKMKMNDGEMVAVKKVHDVFLRAEGADNYLAKFEEECVRSDSMQHSQLLAIAT